MESAKRVTFAPVMMCKEASGKWYTEKIFAAIPVSLGDEIAKFEETKLFMVKCYNVKRTTFTDHDKSRIVTAIFDIVAGPNLS